MSTKKLHTQRPDGTTGDANSPWQGEARETWVSSAIAAATASLRAMAPVAKDVTDGDPRSDAV